MRRLEVLYEGPDFFAPRAAWCLDTLLTPLGARAALVREREAAGACALAYAAAPVPDLPTIPLDTGALALFERDAPLPAAAFQFIPAPQPSGSARIFGTRRSEVPAAFPAEPAAGFALHFDLVAAAFVLLACWDEHTSSERDRFDRLPYEASIFATNPALRIEEPTVDLYGALLRDVLAPRLAELGAVPLPEPGWVWADAPFALALTHDIDNLWRWTRKGLVAAARRTAGAARRRDLPAVRRELSDLGEWAAVHLPAGTDPFWTFPQLLKGEDDRDISSTFFVLAGHTDPVDGGQPATYRRKLPEALALLRDRHEVGLHGNHAERVDGSLLARDRADLQARAGVAIDGIRYHYLRCLYHETLPLADAAGFTYDSSLAFAEKEGFRCGVSFPFHPYCLREERPLDLLELPLALMDTTLRGTRYRSLTADEAYEAARQLLDGMRTSGGLAALLWHHHSFDPHSSDSFGDVYWELVDWAREEGVLVDGAGALASQWRRATTEAAR